MSSSVEPSATSAVASLTETDLSDERLKNLKQKAEEAAEDDFLWKLGVQAPSPNQARKVCQILGVSVEDEKRVKAVAVLRYNYPDILREIGDLASSEEEEMAEPVQVIWGRMHINQREHRKNRALWDKIIEPLLGVKLAGVIIPESSKEGFSARIRHISSAGGMFSWQLFIVNTLGEERITIKPISNSWNTLSSFYYRINTPSGDKSIFAKAAVHVYDKRCLALAKKIAAAYERETRRRRRPAKAVVIKEY